MSLGVLPADDNHGRGHTDFLKQETRVVFGTAEDDSALVYLGSTYLPCDKN